ncbi:hypothetical protein [Leptolyngbya sp. BC1307]|uniref:hypothetical protein n=1 Tax=Leptolyngbya sp. BC1307 TaxID=2029589 RepID=UPI000EFD4A03|nr:hypothetical protein [Leptolyngbya sp. BC1307]
MTITELIPTVKELSSTDKLLLLQLLVQELLQSEGIAHQPSIFDDSPIESTPQPAEDEDDEDDLTIEERLEILRKPPKERGEILAKQAEAMQAYYEQNTEWKDWPVDDIIEY